MLIGKDRRMSGSFKNQLGMREGVLKEESSVNNEIDGSEENEALK